MGTGCGELYWDVILGEVAEDLERVDTFFPNIFKEISVYFVTSTFY